LSIAERASVPLFHRRPG